MLQIYQFKVQSKICCGLKNNITRFLAEDPDSGRRDYLLSRGTLLDVTDLTLASVRVSDPRVASWDLATGLIQGHTPGTASIQVRYFIQ